MSRMMNCKCKELPEIADVGMGEHDAVFSSFQTEIRHGEPLWWLSVFQCAACEQWWLVAADERINDVFLMRRLTTGELGAIVEERKWPRDFKQFAEVLRVGCERGHRWVFGDPECPALVETVVELAREEDGIKLRDLQTWPRPKRRSGSCDPDRPGRSDGSFWAISCLISRAEATGSSRATPPLVASWQARRT